MNKFFLNWSSPIEYQTNIVQNKKRNKRAYFTQSDQLANVIKADICILVESTIFLLQETVKMPN